MQEQDLILLCRRKCCFCCSELARGMHRPKVNVCIQIDRPPFRRKDAIKTISGKDAIKTILPTKPSQEGYHKTVLPSKRSCPLCPLSFLNLRISHKFPPLQYTTSLAFFWFSPVSFKILKHKIQQRSWGKLLSKLLLSCQSIIDIISKARESKKNLS